MDKKQVFKNWLRYLLCFFVIIGSSFLLSNVLSVIFQKQLSSRFFEWSTFLIIIAGFLINIFISIFKLKKKYPIYNWFLWYYIIIQVLFCVFVFIRMLFNINQYP